MKKTNLSNTIMRYFWVFLTVSILTTCYNELENPPLSTEASLTSLVLSLDKAIVEISIDQNKKEVLLNFQRNVDVDDLYIKELTLSSGATTNLQINSSILFDENLTYPFTIRSESGKAVQWKLIANIEITNDIEHIFFREQVPGTLKINRFSRDVFVTIKREADMQKVHIDTLRLLPNVSASISPQTVVDLSSPYQFHLTAITADTQIWTINALHEQKMENDILKLTTSNQKEDTYVDELNQKVFLTLEENSLDRSIINELKVSPYATVSRKIGDTLDFSSGQAIMMAVISETMDTAWWEIYGNATTVKSLSVANQVQTAIIDNQNKVVTVKIDDNGNNSQIKITGIETLNGTPSLSVGEEIDASKDFIFQLSKPNGNVQDWTLRVLYAQNDIKRIEIKDALLVEIDKIQKVVWVRFPNEINTVPVDNTFLSRVVISKLDISKGATSSIKEQAQLDLSNENFSELVITSQAGEEAKWKIYGNASRINNFRVEKMLGESLIDFEKQIITVFLTDEADKSQLNITEASTTEGSDLNVKKEDIVDASNDYSFQFTKPNGEKNDWVLKAYYVGKELLEVDFENALETTLNKETKEITVTLEAGQSTTLKVSSETLSKGAKLHQNTINLEQDNVLKVMADNGDSSKWHINLKSHIAFKEQLKPLSYDSENKRISLLVTDKTKPVSFDTLLGIVKHGENYLTKNSTLDISSGQQQLSILTSNGWEQWTLSVIEALQLLNSHFNQVHEETISGGAAAFLVPLSRTNYMQMGATASNSVGNPWISTNRAASLGGASYLTFFEESSSNYKGGKAIKLRTKKVDILGTKNISPGNVYTGNFVHNAKEIFRNKDNNEALVTRFKPFSSRPVALKVAFKYTPGGQLEEIVGGKFRTIAGEKDKGGIGIMLEKDSKRLASGYYMTDGTSQWLNGVKSPKQGEPSAEGCIVVTIPLMYGDESYIPTDDIPYISDALVRPTNNYVTDFSLMPTHIHIGITSSVRAGALKGADQSTLIVDYIELVY